MSKTMSPADSIRGFLERRGGDMARVRSDLIAAGVPKKRIPGLLAWMRGDIEPNKSSVTIYRKILDEIDGVELAGRGRPSGGEGLTAHNPSDLRGYVGRRARWWHRRGPARAAAAAAETYGLS